jgi:hypothetical protein
VLLITRRGAIRARMKAIDHLKALVVTAREELRHQLCNTPTERAPSVADHPRPKRAAADYSLMNLCSGKTWSSTAGSPTDWI